MDETTPKLMLASVRKKKRISQAGLAESVGVSQATISRLEKEEHQPDLKLVAKIAQELGVEVSELIPEELLNSMHGQAYRETFYAFCPNPLCDRNVTGTDDDGVPVVYWKSGQTYDINRYDEINFCTKCGTDLIKECPSCKRKLEGQGSRYCISCGYKITERPTSNEWKKIEKIEERKIEKAKQKAEDFDDDIPF